MSIMDIDPRSRFDCTPEQYHYSLDILWEALDVKGPQNKTAFELAAERIKSLAAQRDALLAACEAAVEATGGSEHWNGETAKFLKLCEAAILKARGAT